MVLDFAAGVREQTKDLGERFKYHYYNTYKEKTFVALFIKTFGWDCFAVTVVEEVPMDSLVAKHIKKKLVLKHLYASS